MVSKRTVITVTILSALLCQACTNPLEYKPADTADELVVNCLMDTGQTSHLAQLSVSTTQYVRPVQEATLRCYINGALIVETSEIEDIPWYGGDNGRGISFDASLRAGDVVRLEVEAEGRFRAWNEQTVPEAPLLGPVDTARIKHKDEEYFRFDVRLDEAFPEEEEYFRLVIEDHTDAVYYDEDGNEIGRASHSWMRPMHVDDDPILGDGHIASDSGDFNLEIGTPNEYGVFSDALFAGSQARLRPQVETQIFGSVPPLLEGTTSISIDSYAVVRVMSLSQRYYYYLKALNMLKSDTSDLALEGVQIPDNVEGGIGFVGLSNSRTAVFGLGTRVFDMVYY